MLRVPGWSPLTLLLSVALLVSCGAPDSPADGDTVAETDSSSALKSLPATVVGILDMSSGENTKLEDGSFMMYGALRVGGEDFPIQANLDMLESSGITSEISKVRASISAKTSQREGGILYTVISVDKL